MLFKFLLTPVFYSVSIFEMRLDDSQTVKLSFVRAKATHVNSHLLFSVFKFCVEFDLLMYISNLKRDDFKKVGL